MTRQVFCPKRCGWESWISGEIPDYCPNCGVRIVHYRMSEAVPAQRPAPTWKEDLDAALSALDDNRIGEAGLILLRLRDALSQPPGAPAATPAPCVNGHEWSHRFGDDWTPDDGARCDCGQVGWGDAIRKGVTIRRVPAAERPAPTCEWTEDDDGVWHTGCGNAWFFDSGTPAENRQTFCGYCGKHLRVVEPSAPRPSLGREGE